MDADLHVRVLADIPGVGQSPATEARVTTARLALGTAQFGMPYGIANGTGQVQPAAARSMLRLAAAADIDVLDTAIAYGTSEQCLGQAGVEGFRVITKLPPLPADETDPKNWVRRQLAGSLARLRLPRVHGLLLHRPSDLLTPRGVALLEGLAAVRDECLTSRIGVSIYAPSELDRLMSLHPFDLVQAPLNLIDRRLVHSGWLERLAAAGTEVHVRSAFLQGLLLLPPAEQARRFGRWSGLWSRLEAHRRASPNDILAQCLGYALAQPGVHYVVVGADDPQQLQATVAAASARPVDDWPDLACDDEDLINPSNWRSP